jgi:putative oxidoreductase
MRFRELTYALLRIVTGFLFLCHGGQKLFGWFGGMGGQGGTVDLMSLMGLAGMLEFFGGLAVMIGLLTRPIAFLLAGEMAFAYFMAHAPNGPLPLQNRGESAALFCFLFLFFSAHGAGPMSVDAAIGKARGRTEEGRKAMRHRADEPFPGRAA